MIKHVRELDRLVAHDLLIIALWLTFFCLYCVGPKLSIWLLGHKAPELLADIGSYWLEVMLTHLITFDLFGLLIYNIFDTLVIHQLVYESLPIFVTYYFAPWALAFDFSCFLDISAQGQTVAVFFVRMHFSTILSKVQERF